MKRKEWWPGFKVILTAEDGINYMALLVSLGAATAATVSGRGAGESEPHGPWGPVTLPGPPQRGLGPAVSGKPRRWMCWAAYLPSLTQSLLCFCFPVTGASLRGGSSCRPHASTLLKPAVPRGMRSLSTHGGHALIATPPPW